MQKGFNKNATTIQGINKKLNFEMRSILIIRILITIQNNKIAKHIALKINISRTKLVKGAPFMDVLKNETTKSPKCLPKIKNSKRSKTSVAI